MITAAAFIQAVATAAKPWASLYSDSKMLQTGFAFLHLGGLLAAAGFAVAADRATLRARRRPAAEQAVFLSELDATHLPVLAGLALVVATGLAMMLADVDNLLPSPVFWLKMGAFVLLLANGATLQRAGARLQREETNPRRWRALTHAAVRSVVLWTVTLFLGTVLTAA